MFEYYNKNAMPNYLNEITIKQWFRSFNNFLVNIFQLNKFVMRNKMYITFSYDKLKKQYGLYSEDEIIDMIKSDYKINPAIESKIKDVNRASKTAHSNYISGLEELACYIRELNPENGGNIYDELKDLFGNSMIECSILGEYNDSYKEIILYIASIEDFANKNKLSKIDVVEETFIHELFHAYHYNDQDDEICRRHDYTSEVVKESLASFFECEYCFRNRIADYKLVIDSWNNRVDCYPYSGAININNVSLFNEVFSKSKTDFDSALRKLFENDKFSFYKIKNIIEIRKIKQQVKHKKRDSTKYSFQGGIYCKNRLVLEVVKQYISEHQYINFVKLRNVFYDKLQGPFGVVREKNNVDAKNANRYFMKAVEELYLIDGTKVVVSNQWGKDNIKSFVLLARSLGYKIIEL